jgi:NAD(P)-dependent dehydrogenase (short-subunit alcohol dehydrogenase family)
VDITDSTSIRRMFEGVGNVEALVSCAGEATFGALDKLQDGDFAKSLENKLMGQVNLVRLGLPSIAEGGSITLTAGVFSQKPWPGVPLLALVNGALESFVRAAALDLPRGVRINVVSPPFIRETAEKMGLQAKLTAAENARAYVELLEGTGTGAVVYPD